MKRDRDNTDFRKMRESSDERQEGCLFCEINKERVIAENELAYAIGDGFPVTPLNTLIIPKRHTPTYFEPSQAEINACTFLIKSQKQSIETQDRSVDGFNIGINDGASAGQTIFHCHVHLIPRPAATWKIREVVLGTPCRGKATTEPDRQELNLRQTESIQDYLAKWAGKRLLEQH